jgi:uncharacterized protein
MPEYLTPGVYMEEFEIGARPIEGVSTSTAGFLGETERGQTNPCLITSWLQYQRYYGGYFGDDKYLPGAVEGFFNNGGQRCYIARIVKSVTLNDPANPCKPANTAEGKPLVNSTEFMDVNAVGEGNWGNNIALELTKGSISGFRLDVFYWKNPPKLDKWNDEGLNDLKAMSDFLKQNPPTVFETFDNVTLDKKSPNYFEKTVNGISYLIKISIADVATTETLLANLVDLKDKDITKKRTKWLLSGGFDGEYGKDKKGGLVVADYERSDPQDDIPGKRKGLAALADIENISIIYAPQASAVSGLIESLISHCERLKYRFAIIDAEQGSSDTTKLPEGNNDTQYAALYYPWIKVINPETGMLQLMPPGGHVAGIYARSDNERGVHKAPANEVVLGASDVEFQISKGEQGVLNPKGVNVIRAFSGRGIRVWGARTLSSNALWKYINVRRLFIFVEASIEIGTQWVVFEPNNERLWARVKATITQFLTTVWKDGALMGTKAEEAFFVKCDRTTMTQDDIDNGRLICIIGIAPVKPAEFVIFRIAQWAGGSSSEE